MHFITPRIARPPFCDWRYSSNHKNERRFATPMRPWMVRRRSPKWGWDCPGKRASSLPFDQASPDAAIIVAATWRPTIHINSPHLKVNTSRYTPSLLPNLFVACGLLPVPIRPVSWVGMLCHVLLGTNRWKTIIRIFHPYFSWPTIS